ncbi:MAG: peptidoglycan glycosyltransferase, partial [Candidatus Cloacimonadaceae bacterium]
MSSRYKLLVIVFGLASFIWGMYLFSIQILAPIDMTTIIDGRYIPRKEILIPNRGSIYDANGSLMVSSIRYYQLDIDRGAVNGWAKNNGSSLEQGYHRIAKAIADNSSLKETDVLKRLNMGNKLTSIQIGNKFRESELDKIIKAFNTEKLPGLSHTFASMKRLYSKDIVAGRVIGAVREESDGHDPVTLSKSLYKLSGICGIEASHNDILAGEYGWREYLEDAKHRKVPYPNLHEKSPV